MVQITVDTEKDSSATLKRLITFLEEELRHRGEAPVRPNPLPTEPMQVDASNPFGSMFGNDEPSTPSTISESTPAPAQDMFSMFSHESSAPEQSSTIDTSSVHMANETASPSASQLLEEDDVKDVTESLAEQVLRTGSTRKDRSDIRLEPYE